MHNNTELLYNSVSLGYYVPICFDDGDKIIGGPFVNSLLNSVQFNRTVQRHSEHCPSSKANQRYSYNLLPIINGS